MIYRYNGKSKSIFVISSPLRILQFMKLINVVSEWLIYCEHIFNKKLVYLIWNSYLEYIISVKDALTIIEH